MPEKKIRVLIARPGFDRGAKVIALLINCKVPVLKDEVRRFVMPHDAAEAFLNTEYTEDAEKRARTHNG